MEVHSLKILKKPNRSHGIFILFAITFLTLTHILTWYGITHQGLAEADVPVARLIQMYGAPIGLFINYMLWLLLILPIWFLWVQFPFKLKHNDESLAAVDYIATFLFTFVFVVFLEDFLRFRK